jgi:hypothetical protein
VFFRYVYHLRRARRTLAAWAACCLACAAKGHWFRQTGPQFTTGLSLAGRRRVWSVSSCLMPCWAVCLSRLLPHRQ